MAKLHIRVMGIADEKRIIDLIMETVSREGRIIIPIQTNPDQKMLMANRLVIYKILNISVIKRENDEFYEYAIGENFAKAHLKGGYSFIYDEKLNLNPSKGQRFWSFINENRLISGILIGIITTFIGGYLLWILTS